MIIKKDSKGRNLKQNEDQLKDGRYRYRYTDKYGNRKSVYAWKLVKTDKTPSGKKDDLCLREKIRQIERDIEDGIRTYDANITVYDLLYRYLDTKPKIANSTKINYIHMIEKNVKPNCLAKMKVSHVKKSDIKRYYSYLYKERKFATGTIQLYQNLIFPAFQLAVDDSLIRLNPCRDCMKEYVRGSLTSTKYPLSRNEQTALLNFVYNDNFFSKYYVLIAFMLSTGCRIGETLGVTWDDIDFTNKCLNIDHQIIYKKKDGRTKHYSSLPKNKTSRVIPLKDDILSILAKYKQETYFISKLNDYEIDGYRDFVFLNNEMKLYTPNTIVRLFHEIRDKYNRSIDDGDVVLPDFTPHTLRHTFCTRMAENGIDVKVLQEIMGHKNISVTMQVYNHVDFERTKSAVDNIPSALGMS
jgi:integrase